jgi:hypothetical protein
MKLMDIFVYFLIIIGINVLVSSILLIIRSHLRAQGKLGTSVRTQRIRKRAVDKETEECLFLDEFNSELLEDGQEEV